MATNQELNNKIDKIDNYPVNISLKFEDTTLISWKFGRTILKLRGINVNKMEPLKDELWNHESYWNTFQSMVHANSETDYTLPTNFVKLVRLWQMCEYYEYSFGLSQCQAKIESRWDEIKNVPTRELVWLYEFYNKKMDATEKTQQLFSMLTERVKKQHELLKEEWMSRILLLHLLEAILSKQEACDFTAEKSEPSDMKKNQAETKEINAENPKQEAPSETQINEIKIKEVKETQVKESQVKETQISETPINETKVDKTQISETQIKETQIKETQVKETQISETPINETKVDETQVKETQVKETQISETKVSETKVCETKVSEMQVNEITIASTNTHESQTESQIELQNEKENNSTMTKEYTTTTEKGESELTDTKDEANVEKHQSKMTTKKNGSDIARTWGNKKQTWAQKTQIQLAAMVERYEGTSALRLCNSDELVHEIKMEEANQMFIHVGCTCKTCKQLILRVYYLTEMDVSQGHMNWDICMNKTLEVCDVIWMDIKNYCPHTTRWSMQDCIII